MIKAIKLTVTILVSVMTVTLAGIQTAGAQSVSHTVVLWTCPYAKGAKILVEANTIGNSLALDTNATSVLNIVNNKVAERIVGKYLVDSVDSSEAAAVFKNRLPIFYVSNNAGNGPFTGYAQLPSQKRSINFECMPPKYNLGSNILRIIINSKRN